MKRILTIALLLITVASYSQRLTPMQGYGYTTERFAITAGDTTTTKVAGGLTVKNGILYVANGTYWSMVTGSGGTTDSLIFATWKRLYKVNDSMKVVYASTYMPYTGATKNLLSAYRLQGSSLVSDSMRAASSSGFRMYSNSGQEIAAFGAGGTNLGSYVGKQSYRTNINGSLSGNDFVTIGYVDSLVTARGSGKVYAGYGLTNVNDSTLKADTSIMATVNYALDLYNILDAAKISSGSSASLQNLSISGTNGNGFIHLKHQASDATTPSSSSVLFANSSGYMKWKNDGGYYSTLAMPQTANRTYTFQDKSYTLADDAVTVKYSDTATAYGFSSAQRPIKVYDSIFAVRNAPYALTYSSTITLNYNNSTTQTVTLTGNTTFSFSNFPDGGVMFVYITQDGTGGRTATFPTIKVGGRGAGVVTLSTLANATDAVAIQRVGSTYYVNYQLNFN